jgi:DNA repair protein RecN (Recombination protein N)
MFGIDRFRFLFASNKGSEFADIRKVASGGELSRLMLCIKSLIAASTSLPTLIFDEIDTGISGETAMKGFRYSEGTFKPSPGDLHHTPATDCS